MRLLARLREFLPSAAGLRASALLRCPTPRLLAAALATAGPQAVTDRPQAAAGPREAGPQEAGQQAAGLPR